MGCSGSKQIEEWDPVPRCSSAGVSFSEEIKMVNDNKRNCATWLPDGKDVKALVLIAHGLNEHSLAYYGVAIALATQGFAVHAMDHVSHGLSDGRHGVIPDFNILRDDFIEFGNSTIKQYPDQQKRFLLAHSMGSLVGILAAPQLDGLSAVIFSGCALFAGPAAASPFGCECMYPLTQTDCILCLSSCTAGIDPAGPAAPLVDTEVTSNRAELELRRRDVRRFHDFTTNKSAFEIASMIKVCKDEVKNIKMPFMAVHGGDDKVCLPQGSEFLFHHAGTFITAKKLRIYPGLKHEPMHEPAPHGAQSIADVVEYFESFVNGTNDAAGIVSDRSSCGEREGNVGQAATSHLVSTQDDSGPVDSDEVGITLLEK